MPTCADDPGDAFVRLGYDPQGGFVHHASRRDAPEWAVIEAMTAGTDLLRHNNAHRWLADAREVPVARPELRHWFANTWLPAAMRAGLKRYAVVLPETAIGARSVQDQLMLVQDSEVEIESFSSRADALAWLTRP